MTIQTRMQDDQFTVALIGAPMPVKFVVCDSCGRHTLYDRQHSGGFHATNDDRHICSRCIATYVLEGLLARDDGR